tara:strand:- start:390 stop:593 length:204 start_codon:yes stop_codon:yes gene_type:complete
MKTTKQLRLAAARLAISNGCGQSAAELLASAIMWECYLKRGADETQRRMKILPEKNEAAALKLVPRE